MPLSQHEKSPDRGVATSRPSSPSSQQRELAGALLRHLRAVFPLAHKVEMLYDSTPSLHVVGKGTRATVHMCKVYEQGSFRLYALKVSVVRHDARCGTLSQI